MPRRLSLDTTPDRIQTVTLSDSVSVRLRTHWRPRTASWYADLYQADGTPIATGVRLSTSYTLMEAHVLPEGMQGGHFFVRGPDEYRVGDLGAVVQVIWYDSTEIPAETDLGLIVV